MKRLKALEDSLQSKIAELQQQLSGVRMAMRTLSGEPDKVVPIARATRTNVKQTLFRLLEEAGPSGLNATLAVELAAKQNEQLERPTVSSLLSRLKSEGLVSYDGNVYRLQKFTRTAEAKDANAMH